MRAKYQVFNVMYVSSERGKLLTLPLSKVSAAPMKDAVAHVLALCGHEAEAHSSAPRCHQLSDHLVAILQTARLSESFGLNVV